MKNFTVVILTDNKPLYQNLLNLLTKMGFHSIFIAKSYQEAISLASVHQLDIILSSTGIKGEYDGINAVRVVQKSQKLVVIFMCTTHDKTLLQKLAEVDFIGYIKHFNKEELESLMVIAIEKTKLKHTQTSLKKSKNYRFCIQTNILYKDKNPCSLSKKERLFLGILFTNLEILLPYSLIDNILWPNGVSENTRRTFLYRIKKKFPDLEIQIIKGIGVKLE